MKTSARILCLLFILNLMTVFLSAAEYTEEFLQPGGSYFTTDNLQLCSQNIGRSLSIGTVPDSSGLVLVNRSDAGSAVFKVSRAQSVRIGFYSFYELYAEYLPADNTYRMCNAASVGRLLNLFYDAANRSLCVQDNGKLYYYAYNSSTYEFRFIEPKPEMATENPLLYPAYMNVYTSKDGITYNRVSYSLLNHLYGEQLMSTAGTMYCEVVADIPAESKYVKIEINQPSRLILDAGQWVSIRSIIATILANVHFAGDQLVMGGAPEPVASTPVQSSSNYTGSETAPTAEGGTTVTQQDGIVNRVPFSEAGGENVIMGLGKVLRENKATREFEAAVSGQAGEVLSGAAYAQTSAQPAEDSKQSVGLHNAAAKEASSFLKVSGSSNDYTKVVLVILCIIVVLGVTYMVNKSASKERDSKSSDGTLPEVNEKTAGEEPHTFVAVYRNSAEDETASAEYWLF